VVLWTLAMCVIGIALAVFASASLVDAQQSCFMEFPSVPCPGGQDWRVGLLTFAFFGVPLIWVGGLIAAIAGRAVSNVRRERRG
jgi:hypothetical protein